MSQQTAFRRTPGGRSLARGKRQIRKARRLLLHAALVSLGILMLSPPPAESAELVMFEAPACEWCEAWDDEVGVVYHKTSEGRRAPLRRISIHASRPPDLAPIAPVHYSPTFVLMDGAHEVGRIVGYPGEAHFWGLLQALLDRLPRQSAADSMGDM
jgi:hypothetical protein